MKMQIVETTTNEIRLVDDTLLICIKDINLLKNKNKRQLIELMFEENEIVKTFSFIKKINGSIKKCIFNEISAERLKEILEEKEIPLYSLIVGTATYYQKSYIALNNDIEEVYIECHKDSFLDTLDLINNPTKKTIIKCHEISLKEYSELLNNINLNNLNVLVDYQEENTPIKIEDLYNLSLTVSKVVNEINKYNLSDLEKITYVYDIVKYRIYKKDNLDYLNNRDLDRIINGDTIVCSGYSNLFNAILTSLNIKTMPIISYTVNHQRSIVYVNDPKYNIDGVYVFDPTWDRRKDTSEKHYLNRYNYFLMPIGRSKLTARDEVSDVLEVNIEEVVEVLHDFTADNNELMKSINIINSLEKLFNFADIQVFSEYKDKVYTIRENYPVLIKKYYQEEMSDIDFFKLLYQVRRIQYNNKILNNISIDEIIDTVAARTSGIRKLKEQTRKISPLEMMLILLREEDQTKFKINKSVSKLEKEITPNGIGIERDTANIKLIKTLKKVQDKNRES